MGSLTTNVSCAVAWSMAGILPMGSLAAQAAPKVVSRSPDHLAEVDAKTTTLTVVFDRAMSQAGFSVCGGGPAFPKVTKPPKWRDDRTLDITVELVPDHTYQMSLNCPAARNFRSAEGVELAPVPWSFSTLPVELRPEREQKRRNKAALKVLMQTLENRYSYYDLRVDDWRVLQKEHEDRILGARTDKGFAAEAARMLQATEDLHLYFRVGEQVFGCGSRSIDSLYRDEARGRHVQIRRVDGSPSVFVGRTDAGIGYLLITGWNDGVDPERFDGVMTELADTEALVVDVRPNAGGDELLAKHVAAWFVDGTKVYAKNRYRERKGARGFGEVLDRTIEGHGEARHYDKPVAVLTSRYVMSSNEAFVLMMKQADKCTVVGQATFGSSGNPKPFELGNDVTVLVPSWQAMRPDGSVFEGEGIEPDEFVPVTPDDLQSRDPILERALELLSGK